MRSSTFRLAAMALSLGAGIASGAESRNADWPAYLGGKGRNLYSPLQQINRDTVSQLEVAWTYVTGDQGEYQANNLIVEGVLYPPSPTRKVRPWSQECSTAFRTWRFGPIAGRRFPVLAGYASRENTSLFVSKGVGTVYVPVRINCPPDVAILTLRPASS